MKEAYTYNYYIHTFNRRIILIFNTILLIPIGDIRWPEPRMND
jgi:hypothetical protein